MQALIDEAIEVQRPNVVVLGRGPTKLAVGYRCCALDTPSIELGVMRA